MMRRYRPARWPYLVATLPLAFGAASTASLFGQPVPERVPGEGWMRFAETSEAGFDPAKLEAARQTWETLPSSAFLVISNGAVVAAWGEVERRFMCHSVRKSFLSGLYGVYWDRGEIELNKTLADLGIDDEPDPLLESEKQARILDLLKARSGIFHPAAYAGRTDSRPRGSEGPGRYFAYNNWDFNTLATILMQETGEDVFEAFDRYFGRPLQLEDWRLSDGYYHYEPDKSKYPAYPFRMSARDAARFGLLFARNGMWGGERILSEHWVRRSTALYSIDGDPATARLGYGFMWWVILDDRFEPHGAYTALGVGNQAIAVFPELDLVIVNRANTYRGEGTPAPALMDLMEQVIGARNGSPASDPALVPLELATPAEARETYVSTARLSEFEGSWDFPAASLGLPTYTTVDLEIEDGHLSSFSPVSGRFLMYLQEDGTLLEEDSYRSYIPIRDEAGTFDGLADAESIANAAVLAAAKGDAALARSRLALVEAEERVSVGAARAVVALLGGNATAAEEALLALAEGTDPARVEARVNEMGYGLMQMDHRQEALAVFEMNTRVFPDAFNTWDSLGEAYMELGREEESLAAYERSLALNPENENAERMIERIRTGETP